MCFFDTPMQRNFVYQLWWLNVIVHLTVWTSGVCEDIFFSFFSFLFCEAIFWRFGWATTCLCCVWHAGVALKSCSSLEDTHTHLRSHTVGRSTGVPSRYSFLFFCPFCLLKERLVWHQVQTEITPGCCSSCQTLTDLPLSAPRSLPRSPSPQPSVCWASCNQPSCSLWVPHQNTQGSST